LTPPPVTDISAVGKKNMGVSGDLKKDMGVAQKKVKGGVQMEVRKFLEKMANLYFTKLSDNVLFFGEKIRIFINHYGP
jgi:hypothetical protein